MARGASGWHKAAMPFARGARTLLVFCAVVAVESACAGSGRFYPCAGDGGPTETAADCRLPPSDGGKPTTPFLSAARTVWHDGAHASSSDAVVFAGATYLAFRSAQGRGFDGAAHVQVLRSLDHGQTWTPTTTVSAAGTDPRDPKLTLFQGQLWLTFTSWDSADPQQRHTRVEVATTTDGAQFSTPAPLELPQPSGSPGLAAWRPRPINGALWLPSWVDDDLLAHTDRDHVLVLTGASRSFSLASTVPVGPGGVQAELLARSDGTLWTAIPERPTAGSPERQTICSAPAGASPAWTCWSVTGPAVEEPLLFEWTGLLFLAGRHDVGGGKKRTAIWQVEEADRGLQLIANLAASFGDTGGPTLVPLDNHRALLAYTTTSAQDGRLGALGHEPALAEAVELGLSADVMAVTMDMAAANAGR